MRNIAGVEGSNIYYRRISYQMDQFDLVEDMNEPFLGDNYPIASNHYLSEVFIEHTRFYTPCGLYPVWLEGVNLLSMY